MPLNRIAIVIAFLFFCVALLVIMQFFDPTQSTWYPQCPFYKLTQLQCPGCGATRTLYTLSQGHFSDLFRYNILFFPLVLTAMVLFLFPKVAQNKFIGYIVLFVILIFWIIRNFFDII